MAGRVIRIERVAPRKGVVEAPVRTEKGYQLADPAHGADKHRVAHAVYVETLEEAASLIARGFSLRMGANGKSPSLVARDSLRIVREEAAQAG
ncbi:hypothetical protein [Paracoccus sanguinis]|uniref:Uncharacterized protein n=1 Tax=Paracoccus sanguinis TaxID=1545044 RepID=A0A1H2ZC84_9RHOB|nr:hypothetical protein [Paracoccus sanguinis]KGJ18595.1 hypothetical protein IX57_03575 [Paracoccus sanguinis]SDX15102.1 hypothetical protein SAMN05444276_10324 [Paracoccus sanguinis]